jgi:hypothetical protein
MYVLENNERMEVIEQNRRKKRMVGIAGYREFINQTMELS